MVGMSSTKKKLKCFRVVYGGGKEVCRCRWNQIQMYVRLVRI